MQNSNSIAKRPVDHDADSLYFEDPEDSRSDFYYGAATEPSQRQQLAAIFGILRKRWMVIAGLTLVVTAMVLVYEARKPDYYTADVRVQVNNEMNPAASDGKAGSITVNPGSDPAYFTTQLQILEGSGLLRRVVKTLDLENSPTFLGADTNGQTALWQNMLRVFGLYKPPRVKTADAATASKKLDFKIDPTADLDSQAEALAPYVDTLKDNLTVTPVKDKRTASAETRLINIEFRHRDPQMAAKIVNAIADTYVLQNLERKIDSNANTSDFLQKRIAELQSQIRSGEERLINYAKNNQILSLDTTQNTVVQRLADLNTKLSQAESDRIAAESAYRAALQNPMAGATAESKDARTTALETQLSTLRQKLEQLKVEYTEEWPEVKQTRQQIAAIETELQTSRKRTTDSQIATLEQAYREASSREKALRSNFESQRGAVLNQNEAAINYRIIQQEIDTNKTLLDNLLQRSRETEVVLNGTPNNVLVVDRALVPRSPDGPQRTKNVLIGFFASLLAGIGLAFALNWLDDTIRAADEIELRLGTPVIGMIPRGNSGSPRRLFSGKEDTNGTKRVGKQVYQLSGFETPLVVEAFHQLRTSLLLSTAGGAPQTLLVTSGEPFEGKTVTSLNLAKSLAQLGNRVLLIDADFRCPKMHVINNVANTAGLSTLLTAKQAGDDLIDNVIQKNVVSGLDILPSGPQVPNPANLFASPEMRKLLTRLGLTYSHIIIDSPPVLYFADSVILAAGVDAVILIARANYSSRDVLARAKKRMQDVRANVVGIVVNDVAMNNYQYRNNVYYQQLDQPSLGTATGGVLHLD